MQRRSFSLFSKKSNKGKFTEIKPIKLNKSALKAAIKAGDLETIKTYVESNNEEILHKSQGSFSRTILDYAAANLQIEIVAYLLEKGAKATFTAVNWALKNLGGNKEKTITILKILVDKIENANDLTALLKIFKTNSQYCDSSIKSGSIVALSIIQEKIKASGGKEEPSNSDDATSTYSSEFTSCSDESSSESSSNEKIEELKQENKNVLAQVDKLTSKIKQLESANATLTKEVKDLKERIPLEPKKNINPFL